MHGRRERKEVGRGWGEGGGGELVISVLTGMVWVWSRKEMSAVCWSGMV